MAAGCTEDIESIPQREGYILFEAGVETRAPIITSMRSRSFGVLGYSYSGTWAGNVIMAKPDVFQSQRVDVSDNGVSSYSPLKSWVGGKAYTFFAYHPYNGVTVSTAAHEGVPFIEYTIPASTDPDRLEDLMVAKSREDLNGNGSRSVAFTFSHLLFCMDLEARNMNAETVRIRNVRFRINKLTYSSIHANMDGTDVRYGGESINGREFAITDGAEELEIAPLDIQHSSATPVSRQKNLMLIPQSRIDGVITLEKYDPQSGSWITASRDMVSDREFLPGRKYTAVMNFSGDAMTVAIIESGEWTDKVEQIEFE